MLLAEDCADVDPDWLDAAASAWAKREPFLPRACELRAEALAVGRITNPARILPVPPPPPPPPPQPPLTDDEIARLPSYLVRMGIKMGEIDPDQAERIRESDRSPEGEKPEALSAKHESAVPPESGIRPNNPTSSTT
jgi:hypothetical protein